MKSIRQQFVAALVFAVVVVGGAACGAVTLHPGDNIQSLVTANAINTTFIFSAGTYTNQSIIPKTGNVFDGQGVAVFDGANTATKAFSGAGGNVTIKNLTVQRYNSPSQNAAVDCALGSGWIVTNCVIQSNAAVGVKFGTNSVIVNNLLIGNGQEGFAGSGTGWLVKNNQINNNNTAHQNWTLEAGGGKAGAASGGTFDGNTVTNNFGPGLWLSGGSFGNIIRSNICIGNYGPGILVEISRNNSISNNLCFGNGLGGTNWGAAQILLSSSPSNIVSGNTLGLPFASNGLYGIFAMDQARTNAGLPIHANGNEVFSNSAWFWDTKPGIQGCAADDGYPVHGTNHFHNNSYFVINASVNYFSWETNGLLSQAQVNAHEIGSTIDTNMKPRLNISRSNSLMSLYWPSWALNYKPWSGTNHTAPATWSAVTNPVSVATVQSSVILGASNSARFFRLVGPSSDSLSAGLIAHYSFDEHCSNATPGCVIDSSGLGNNGTLGNATSGTNPMAPLWTPNGKFAGAYLYNGIVQPGNIVAVVGEGIYLPQGVDVDGNWTLSVWARLNNVTNHTSSTIYCQKQSTEDCRNLLIHWEGDMDETMTLQVRDSACHELLLHNLPSNPMIAGQWFHLVGVGNNKNYSFYINGALQQSQVVTNMGSLSCNFHGIGVMYDDFGRYYNHYLDGAVDEMRIYNRALSPTEILALYNQGGGAP